uniref:Uncharacterized protein n=1 Tax=Nelumbo nucifera TaxID=4432 RepID=A0A822Z2X8_NELNU|nr:TPA_asm: hypothetical protein HUJ06_008436 [Nelumbo nucifera]
MDGEKIIETLDSLWFFSNILSSSQPLSTSCTDGKPAQSQSPLNDSITADEPKPTIPVLQKQQNESSDSEILGGTSLKDSDSGLRTDLQNMKPADMEALKILESMEKEQNGKRDKKWSKCRSKRGNSHKKKEFSQSKGSGDFDFILREVRLDGGSVFGIPALQMMERKGFQRFGDLHHLNMPPLSDGMAMKKHLKSWAYAVACTVR